MSNWKIKRSRKAGIIPNVGQFPDSETVIWNQADGKLWGLRIIEGNKTVVLIGGGVNTIGETHTRLHALDSALDHAPASVEDYGKYVRANPDDGKIEFVAPLIDDKNFTLFISDVTESTIQHNLNKLPSVQIKCVDHNVVISNVEYIDINTIRVTFEDTFTGTVILN